jgi:ZIP family zinc transporter
MTSAIVFGMIAAGVALLALILVQRAAGFTGRNGPLAAAFAGGLVITISITHLIPEALIMAPNAPWLVLGGFAFGFVVHTLLGGAGHHHHGGETPPANRVAALSPVIAIAMHSALDGVIYSVTFAVDTATGLIAATGLIIHEFPEALICFVLLQRAGLKNGPAALYAFLASGATTFAAAALSAPFAGALDPQTLGVLFALVAGLLLHVGAAHLIHEAAEAGALRGGFAVFAGAGVAVLMALGHSHHHGHDHGHDHAHEHPHDGHHDHDHDAAEIHSDHDADHDHGHDHDHDDGHDHPHF